MGEFEIEVFAVEIVLKILDDFVVANIAE